MTEESVTVTGMMPPGNSGLRGNGTASTSLYLNSGLFGTRWEDDDDDDDDEDPGDEEDAPFDPGLLVLRPDRGCADAFSSPPVRLQSRQSKLNFMVIAVGEHVRQHSFRKHAKSNREHV
jgi:hypothetical protein